MSTETSISSGPAALHDSWTLTILSLLMAFASISTDIYLPAMPTMAASLHALPGSVELKVSGYLVGFCLGQLFWGPLSDRLGRRLPLAIGMLLYTLPETLPIQRRGLVVPLFLFISCTGLIAANSVTAALNLFPEVAGSVSALVGAGQFGFGIWARHSSAFCKRYPVAAGCLDDILRCWVHALCRASGTYAVTWLDGFSDQDNEDRAQSTST